MSRNQLLFDTFPSRTRTACYYNNIMCTTIYTRILAVRRNALVYIIIILHRIRIYCMCVPSMIYGECAGSRAPSTSPRRSQVAVRRMTTETRGEIRRTFVSRLFTFFPVRQDVADIVGYVLYVRVSRILSARDWNRTGFGTTGNP